MSIDEEDNSNSSILYSGIDRKERIRCIAHGYPTPKMTLLHNGAEVHSSKYIIQNKKETEKQVIDFTLLD